jgi:hypothetical protein
MDSIYILSYHRVTEVTENIFLFIGRETAANEKLNPDGAKVFPCCEATGCSSWAPSPAQDKIIFLCVLRASVVIGSFLAS